MKYIYMNTANFSVWQNTMLTPAIWGLAGGAMGLMKSTITGKDYAANILGGTAIGAGAGAGFDRISPKAFEWISKNRPTYTAGLGAAAGALKTYVDNLQGKESNALLNITGGAALGYGAGLGIDALYRAKAPQYTNQSNQLPVQEVLKKPKPALMSDKQNVVPNAQEVLKQVREKSPMPLNEIRKNMDDPDYVWEI